MHYFGGVSPHADQKKMMVDLRPAQGFFLRANNKPLFLRSSVRAGLLVTFMLQPLVSQGSASFDELMNMSLRELMQQTTTVSNRQSEEVITSAYAVTVLTQQDIRNSGLKTLPELMRLVPGLHVKRIDGNKWAISSRRQAARFSGAMQVLMDGRSLYSPLFGGTYWELQDMFLDDIERIEIVRGPGSATWGANAVTGVINVVTKSANETRQGLLTGAVGQGELANEVAVRQGWSLEQGAARVYAKWRNTDQGIFLHDPNSNNSVFPDGTGADDGTRSARAGFRLDYAQERLDHSLQGDIYQARSRDTRSAGNTGRMNETLGYNLNYQAKYQLAVDRRLGLRVIVDSVDSASETFEDERRIYDIEGEYVAQLGQHGISTGVSVRHMKDATALPSGVGLRLDPDSRSDQYYSLFVQDHWHSGDQKTLLTAGIRFEQNPFAGLVANPSLRAARRLDEDWSLWAAVSQSARTGSRVNADGCIGTSSQCFVDISAANSDQAAIVRTYELGLRGLFASNLSMDLAIFYDREVDPLSNTLGLVDYKNEYYGAELDLRYRLSDQTAVQFNASRLFADPDRRSNVERQDVEPWVANLTLQHRPADRLALNLWLNYADGQADFPSLLRLDANALYQLAENFQLQLALNNLFDDTHFEAGDPTLINSAVRRGGAVTLQWQF